MHEGAWDGDSTIQPIRQQKHIRLGEQVGHVEAALRQFRVSGVAGIPELLIRAQLIELGQRDDRIHILCCLMPEFVGGKSQREGGSSVERQLHGVIEVAVQRLQDGERIIHGA